MISMAISVYKKGDDLNGGDDPLKTLIMGRVESLMDEEDGDLDAKTFGEDIFNLVEEFAPEDLDIVVEFRYS